VVVPTTVTVAPPRPPSRVWHPADDPASRPHQAFGHAEAPEATQAAAPPSRPGTTAQAKAAETTQAPKATKSAATTANAAVPEALGRSLPDS